MSKEDKDLMAHVDRLMAQAAVNADTEDKARQREEALNILTGYLKSKDSAYLCLISVGDGDFLISQQQPDKIAGMLVLAGTALPHIAKHLREAVALLDELSKLGGDEDEEEEVPE